MANNSSSKFVHLVPILCQNWQFWGPNCIANKKIGNLAIISQFWAPKLPFFIIHYLFVIRKQIQFLFIICEQSKSE